MWWLIQELLEKYNVPFVGTRSSECRKAFDKVKGTFFFIMSKFLQFCTWMCHILLGLGALKLSPSSYESGIEDLTLFGILSRIAWKWMQENMNIISWFLVLYHQHYYKIFNGDNFLLPRLGMVQIILVPKNILDTCSLWGNMHINYLFYLIDWLGSFLTCSQIDD